jgi:hypothetical protein
MRRPISSSSTGSLVELLEPHRGVGAGGEPGDLGEHLLGVLVPGPQALEVEDAEPAEVAEQVRARR